MLSASKCKARLQPQRGCEFRVYRVYRVYRAYQVDGAYRANRVFTGFWVQGFMLKVYRVLGLGYKCSFVWYGLRF